MKEFLRRKPAALAVFSLMLVALLTMGGAPSFAQTKSRFQHDAQQAIRINADSLEVLQAKNLAIFKGNVDVVQGKIRLRAAELRVYYQGGDGGVSGAIVKILATGKVVLMTPQEEVRGSRAEYDVEKQLITLNGNVVLTRGRNIIKGQRLVLNMLDGSSKITGLSGGRVEGIFVPPKKRAVKK